MIRATRCLIQQPLPLQCIFDVLDGTERTRQVRETVTHKRTEGSVLVQAHRCGSEKTKPASLRRCMQRPSDGAPGQERTSTFPSVRPGAAHSSSDQLHSRGAFSSLGCASSRARACTPSSWTRARVFLTEPRAPRGSKAAPSYPSCQMRRMRASPPI